MVLQANCTIAGCCLTVPAAGSELAEADARLVAQRGELARLVDVEQPRLEQHLREVQVGVGAGPWEEKGASTVSDPEGPPHSSGRL